ncbi:MAG TPA: hypothetical protein VIM16_00855 [Mucilaginibacter sp.]|jgi:hypothetical protein
MSSTPYPRYKAWKANGTAPANGYYLYTYDAGTTNPRTTWSDSALTTPNANPIILDANGEANVYLDTGSYRFDLTTPAGALINTFDGASAAANPETGSFVATITGGTTSPTVTVLYHKVGYLVTLTIPPFTLTSNTTTMTLTGLPVALRPVHRQDIHGVEFYDNSTIYPGALIISNATYMIASFKSTFNAALSQVFTNVGNKGMYNGVQSFWTVTYTLQT